MVSWEDAFRRVLFLLTASTSRTWGALSRTFVHGPVDTSGRVLIPIVPLLFLSFSFSENSSFLVDAQLVSLVSFPTPV